MASLYRRVSCRTGEGGRGVGGEEGGTDIGVIGGSCKRGLVKYVNV